MSSEIALDVDVPMERVLDLFEEALERVLGEPPMLVSVAHERKRTDGRVNLSGDRVDIVRVTVWSRRLPTAGNMISTAGNDLDAALEDAVKYARKLMR